MKMRPQAIILFAAGALVAVSAWRGLAVKDAAVHTQPAVQLPPREPQATHWPPEKIAAALKALEDAPDGEPRLQAAIELGQIPVADIPALLESIPLIENQLLTLPCKTLLIHWAASDGEAATCWAWKRFYKEGAKWLDAFRETGSSWAWHDPSGLYRWAMESPCRTEADEVAATRMAVESEVPVLDSDEFNFITRCLITEEPRLAIELKAERGGFSTADKRFASRLQTPEQVQEALLACKGLDQLKPNVVHMDQMLAWSLLERWKELDPEEFAKSKYGYLISSTDYSKYQNTAKEWSAVPAEERAATANRLTADLTGKARDMQISSLASEWAAISPTEAARWLDSLPDGRPTYRAIAKASASADLPAALAWVDGLPAAEREASRLQAFDAWTENNPGRQPDMSGWRQGWIEAWKDLEAVGE